MNPVSGTTFEEIVEALTPCVYIEVADDHLQVVDGCESYTIRNLTKAQAQTWIAGLAKLVESLP